MQTTYPCFIEKVERQPTFHQLHTQGDFGDSFKTWAGNCDASKPYYCPFEETVCSGVECPDKCRLASTSSVTGLVDIELYGADNYAAGYQAHP